MGKRGTDKVKPNLIDRVLAYAAPRMAASRMQARHELAAMDAAYHGADRTGATDDWDPSKASPDVDAYHDLGTLRERSHDLNRNTGEASALTRSFVDHIIGTGLLPNSTIDETLLGVSPTVAEEWQHACEQEWASWGRYSDVGNRMNWWQQIRLSMTELLSCGEALLKPTMVADPLRPIELRCENIAPERLENPWAEMPAGTDVRMGVECGAAGEVVAYWIRAMHPGDAAMPGVATEKLSEFRRIPLREATGRPGMIHIYEHTRTGMSRGIPILAPVLTALRHMQGYKEAEHVAAHVAACYAGFVTRQLGTGSFVGAETDKQGKRIKRLEPGLIAYLKEGEQINFGNPSRPSSGFEAFVSYGIRSIAASAGLPYEVVAKDFSKSNFSSARAALLEAYLTFRSYQHLLGEKGAHPFYAMLIEEAWLKGRLPRVPFYKAPELWCAARWVGQGQGWVDPVKEATAASLRVAGNISTLSDECAAVGRKFEDVIAQRKREKEALRAAGLDEPVQIPGQTPDKDEDEDEDEEVVEDDKDAAE